MNNIELPVLNETKGCTCETDKHVSNSTEQYKSIVTDSLKNIINTFHEEQDEAALSAYSDERSIIEVHCKGIWGYCFVEVERDYEKQITPGQSVIISNDECIDIATVYEVSEIVKIKRSKMGLSGEKLPKVLRIPNEQDLSRYRKNLEIEAAASPTFKKKVDKCGLLMKLVDVHYQFDKKKIFFFYTSDGRVDFRELARELAAEFKTRIELRQIGVRDEAKRIGGLGTCGREYCCSSFLNNFKRITTQLACDQNLSANMSKLSGPCGKLKCCLSFEIEEEQ